MKAIITNIITMDTNGYINDDNRTPYKIPEFMKEIRSLTLGCWMIIGREAFETIEKRNHSTYIVVTSDKDYRPVITGNYKVHVATGRDRVFKILSDHDIYRVYCVGGKQIFEMFEDCDNYIICKIKNKLYGRDRVKINDKGYLKIESPLKTSNSLNWLKVTLSKKQDNKKKIDVSMDTSPYIPPKRSLW